MITLKHGTQTLQIYLDEHGCILKTVHTWPDGVAIDDVWSRKPAYQNRTPDFFIQSHINTGWTLA